MLIKTPNCCSHRCPILSFPVCFYYLHISTLIRPLTSLSTTLQPRYTYVSNLAQCIVGAVALACTVLNRVQCTLALTCNVAHYCAVYQSEVHQNKWTLVLLTSQARFWAFPKTPATYLNKYSLVCLLGYLTNMASLERERGGAWSKHVVINVLQFPMSRDDTKMENIMFDFLSENYSLKHSFENSHMLI